MNNGQNDPDKCEQHPGVPPCHQGEDILVTTAFTSALPHSYSMGIWDKPAGARS
jgi:hypothetical protein